VGTHGRSFWILDDITPLRHLQPGNLATNALLFPPQKAWRFRWNKNTDTPLPPDEPAGENPPDGAVVHYLLRNAAREVSLEIVDRAGTVVRRYRSDDTPEPLVEGRNIVDGWIRRPRPLSTSAGLHRFVWDLHGTAPLVTGGGYPIAAIWGNTPREPRGPWAVPGLYTVRLSVDGQTLTAPLELRMDPRVKSSPADLSAQLELSAAVAADLARTRGVKAGDTLHTRLTTLYNLLQEADAAPTPAQREAAADLRRQVDELLRAH
jgi:hypothetical protein